MAKLDVKQIMGVAKKNAVSIAAGAVALVAIAVPFVVADGWKADVQNKLSASAATAGNVESMAGKARKLPRIDPDAPDAPALDAFPTRSVIDAGQAAIKHLTGQSNAMLEESLKFNVHRPLVPEVFTAPAGGRYSTAFFRFRDEYAKMIPDGLNAMMNAGRPYQPEEIARAVTATRDQIARDRSIRQAGQVINATEVQALQQRAQIEVPLQMRNEIASRHAVYVSPTTWTISPGIQVATAPAPDVVWMAQLSLWMQEDVAKIVSQMNAGSKSVYTSPVKHLIAVTIPLTPSPSPYVLPRGGGGGEFGGPVAVPVTKVNPAAPLTFNRASTLTGRSSNGFYDVVHYSMTVRVREDQIAPFLAAIPKGRLHYVLNVEMRSVDSAAEATAGFIYGNDPVVELTIDCEALYLRQWTEKLMPKAVRQLVGIEDPPPATAQF